MPIVIIFMENFQQSKGKSEIWGQKCKRASMHAGIDTSYLVQQRKFKNELPCTKWLVHCYKNYQLCIIIIYTQ